VVEVDGVGVVVWRGWLVARWGGRRGVVGRLGLGFEVIRCGLLYGSGGAWESGLIDG
jgi:hypothetical protein